MNWDVWKPRLIRHGACFFLGWLTGPTLAAWTTEALVAMGMRGDFTLLDFFWRVFLILILELLWFYAPIYLAQVAARKANPPR